MDGVPEQRGGTHRRGRSRLGRRRLAGLATAAVAAALIGAGGSGLEPALAVPGLAVTGTSLTLTAPGSTATLTGFAISGGAPSDTLLVSVDTDLGSLALTSSTGLTLSYGYGGFSGAQLSFTGTRDDVNAALAGLTLAPGASPGQAHVTLTVTPNSDGIAYLPATGHYYQFIADPGVSWTAAQSAATTNTFDGQPGYLASIPSSSANTFVANNIQGAQNVWFGAVGTDYPAGYGGDAGIQRVWTWSDGPLAGEILTECSTLLGSCTHVEPGGTFSSWASGEPNNSGYTGPGTGEHSPVTNWNSSSGAWNDLASTNGGSVAGYVVEYGGLTNLNDSSTDFTGLATVTSTLRVAAAPSAPAGVTATAGERSASVSWNAPGQDNGSTISGYTVTAAPGGAHCTTASAVTRTCTVTGLSAGTGYRFTVVAHSDLGDSAPSAQSGQVVALPPTGAPTAVVALSGNARATVSWTAASAGATTVARYRVTAAPGGSTCTTASAAVTSCTVTGLHNGTTYSMVVTALAADGATISTSSAATVRPWAVISTPTSGIRAGRPLTVAASGFAPGATVTFRLSSGQVLGRARASAQGIAQLSPLMPVGAPEFPVVVASGTGSDHQPLTRSLRVHVRARYAPPTLRFTTLSSRLTAADRRALRAAAPALRTARSIRLDGYTQTEGNHAANLRLSRNRVRAVVAELRHLGVRSHIVVAWHAGASPVSRSRQSLNRRVVLTVRG